MCMYMFKSLKTRLPFSTTCWNPSFCRTPDPSWYFNQYTYITVQSGLYQFTKVGFFTTSHVLAIKWGSNPIFSCNWSVGQLSPYSLLWTLIKHTIIWKHTQTRSQTQTPLHTHTHLHIYTQAYTRQLMYVTYGNYRLFYCYLLFIIYNINPKFAIITNSTFSVKRFGLYHQ